jgi:hypothetical protein
VQTVGRHWKVFSYPVLLLTLMITLLITLLMTLLITLLMFLWHGTRDLYPDFLKSAPWIQPGHGLRHCNSVPCLRHARRDCFRVFFATGGHRSSLAALGWPSE